MNCLRGTRWARKSSSQRRTRSGISSRRPVRSRRNISSIQSRWKSSIPRERRPEPLIRELAALVEDHVVLHLVAEHRDVAAVELELDSLREQPRRARHEALLGGRGGVGPGRRRRGARSRCRRCPPRPRWRRAPASRSSRACTRRAALPGDPVGHVEVVPVPLREGEVAVERVDEDLEGLLERVQEDPVLGGGRLPGQPLGRHPELAQVAQQRGGDPERGRRPGTGPGSASGTDRARSRPRGARRARPRAGTWRCSRPPRRDRARGRGPPAGGGGTRASAARRSSSRCRGAPWSGSRTAGSAPARSRAATGSRRSPRVSITSSRA